MAAAKANAYGRMLGRQQDNRLEPECWPNVEPTFRFTKDQKFFAIGSCFAKNIRKQLALDGYQVLGDVANEGNARNRYTPPAIFQELSWAAGILARDDVVSAADVEPLLMEVRPGRWTDLWCRSGFTGSRTFEEAVRTRKELYAHFRSAFFADVVIITLGLIEAWWDNVAQCYVEFDAEWARRPDRARFEFERLSFESSKDYVDRSLRMLLDGDRHVMITTSPVSLARTFTDSDVIVANTHSKAVLRAVAGELAAEHERVDYFPSYEMATLTRRPEVWDDDLVHVQPAFIARILERVTRAYVPGSFQPNGSPLHMANLVDAGRWEEAARAYDAVADELWEAATAAGHVAGMRLAKHRKQPEIAHRHACAIPTGDELQYETHPHWMFDVLRVLQGSAEGRERAAEVHRKLVTLGRSRPQLLFAIFAECERRGDQDGLRELIDLVIEANPDHVVLADKVAGKLQRLGRTAEALALVERQLEHTPNDTVVLARRARLLLALSRLDDAIGLLERISVSEPHNVWATASLARALERRARIKNA